MSWKPDRKRSNGSYCLGTYRGELLSINSHFSIRDVSVGAKVRNLLETTA